MKQPSKQQLKDRLAQLELIISRTLVAGTFDPRLAIAHLSVDWDCLQGQDLRDADIAAKITRRLELGLSLVCTADELDATPMENINK